jgi:hypothetical protein
MQVRCIVCGRTWVVPVVVAVNLKISRFLTGTPTNKQTRVTYTSRHKHVSRVRDNVMRRIRLLFALGVFLNYYLQCRGHSAPMN